MNITKFVRTMLTFFAATMLAGSLSAAPTPGSATCGPACGLRCIWPDDYCPKPLPCVWAKWCGQCDDYCPKPLPCVVPKWCGQCDDYCPKPLPCVMPKTWPQCPCPAGR